MDFRVDLVGGPFDGATDIYLLYREQPPDRVFAFTCKGGRWCRRRERCVKGEAHTWIAEDDEERPPNALPYGLRSWEPPAGGEEDGVAVYGRGDFWPLATSEVDDEIGDEIRQTDLVPAL